MKKIISFALWGNNPKYLIGAIKNAELAKVIYPEWIARFYVGTSVPKETLEKLFLNGSEVVDMGIPGDWTGMFWRFLPAGDPDVEAMISRDVDSRLSFRESEAVAAWFKSMKGFHIMRDHPCHATEILGGMWGVRGGMLRNMKQLIDEYNKGDFWQVDQNFLREKIYPLVKLNSCVHDEFFQHCSFPTARNQYEFVGDVFDENDKRHDEYWRLLKNYLEGK